MDIFPPKLEWPVDHATEGSNSCGHFRCIRVMGLWSSDRQRTLVSSTVAGKIGGGCYCSEGVISMALWGKKWAKCGVLAQSEHMAVVHCLTSRTARIPLLMNHLHCLHYIIPKHYISISMHNYLSVHIKSYVSKATCGSILFNF